MVRAGDCGYGRTVPQDDQAGASVWRDIVPRRPTSEERVLLEALVDAVGDEELTGQARAVEVIGTCTCGCSSVRLRTSSPPLTGQALVRIPGSRRDHFAVAGVSSDSAGGDVDVAVHVVDGRLWELEVYAGSATPVDVGGLSRPIAIQITG